MLIGYARVSTSEQETAAQVTALKAAGCERIYREKASGGRWDRPELHRLLDQLRRGDVLVVWKLDRLSRSLRDVLTIRGKTGGKTGAACHRRGVFLLRDRGQRNPPRGSRRPQFSPSFPPVFPPVA